MTTAATFQWSIHRSGTRTAKASGLLLEAANGRRGGWGPVVWAVYNANGPVARGEVWQPGRYHALVRQAMFEAEQAAIALLTCDDCGRADGTHSSDVEH